jgi:hypothetical protein
MKKLLASILFFPGIIMGQEIKISPALVTRQDILKAELSLPAPQKGPARLEMIWSDSFGRVVAREEKTVQLGGTNLPFELPLQRAVAMENFLALKLTTVNGTIQFPKSEFIVTPDDPWDDYQVIMYYPYRPEQQAALRNLGVTAGQLQNLPSHRPDGGVRWWKYNYRFYVDQMADDFFAPYHTPEFKDKERRMKEAKNLYKSDRSRKDAFIRHSCLNDPAAENAAMAAIRSVVTAQQRFRPFYYSTDETGVANLVEAWDFCFCLKTLGAMRTWLLSQYGSLEAINREWGTRFGSMEEVTPLSTDEMMKRGDDNLSPWADHRTFMNLSFANAARKASETVHSIDPTAIAGLNGCQMPSAFGGYDYWRLSQAIDVAEPYNIGSNREIWRSFAPQKPAVTTGFGADDMELWRLWFQALHGDRGVIIYDEENRYLEPAGTPTKLGSLVAPTYRELTGGIMKQLLAMERTNDAIAIHYSHPSITAHWMLERRPLGEAWVSKGSRDERLDSDFLRLRQSMIYLLEDNLRQYQFVSYEQLENGSFDQMPTKVMFLPQSIAISKAEAEALRRFVERGGTLIADCRTGLMDSHCKLLPRGQLDDLFGIERKDLRYSPGRPGLHPIGLDGSNLELERISAAEPGVRVLPGATALYRDNAGKPAVIVKPHAKGRTIYLNAVLTNYHRWRLHPAEGDSLRRFWEGLLHEAGIGKRYAIVRSDGSPATGIEIHPWRSGNLEILGIHRNYGLGATELGPPEYHKQDALEVPMELTLKLGKEMELFDIRNHQWLGRRSEYTFHLDKIQPTLLTILPTRPGSPKIEAPAAVPRGILMKIPLTVSGVTPETPHALRMRLLDPDNRELSELTHNLKAQGGKVIWELPLAVNLPQGDYILEATDIPTGGRSTKAIRIQ